MPKTQLFWSLRKVLLFVVTTSVFITRCLLLTAMMQDLCGWFPLPTAARLQATEKLFFFFSRKSWVPHLHLQCEREGNKRWTKLPLQSPLSPLTSKSKAFPHWVTVYHLMPEHWVNWAHTRYICSEKTPRLGGPKMWDHVHRPPVGLSLPVQYHSCQGPCTRWHSLSPPLEKMFQFRLGEKTKHKTQGLWQVSALTNPEKLLSIAGRPSKHPNRDV